MRTRIFAILFILSIILSACSKPAAPIDIPTAEPTSVVVIEEPTADTATNAVGSIEDAKFATIQIEAQGSFVDPEFGQQLNTAGRGSGFIIDPSGIAVTNNHVVTGAALIKVWVGGNTKPLNARILGVSECWDLAVIDIEGDGFPYFEWYEGNTDPGVEVFSAGFPLGDPEYTLTKGIISKANADGETSWASVDAVIEHDARIRGGNSGGPLLSKDGKVIGINYAGSDQYDTNFAIKAEIAQSIIAKLESGVDFESIGVNGTAVSNEDGSITGIWVASVKSGSPADKAGIKGGDIITKMEGLVLATDGTMSSYCDILRTRSATDTYSLEVLRFATEEFLEGQINGRTLEQSFSFAQQVSEQSDITLEDNPAAPSGGYITIQDDEGAIQVDVPAAWAQVDGSIWADETTVYGASISAAADLEGFTYGYYEPGIFYAASDEIAQFGGYVQLLDIYRDSYMQDCELIDRYDYADSAFEGKYDLFSNCLGEDNVLFILSARPINNPSAYLVLLIVNMISDADFDTLDQILATFDVVGYLP
ncbi:MAG: trypsin-like peptidase domain-containing protein [Anaerolineaceae bacterium]|jgi:serine protease Do|nr:trypsin-like peptidase domain-containing protein [Anaerolineaceae bacterium]MDD4043605.1 trypsin-like peptidase domain-containing protein [Anaerolineaceae bacterium]MDD4578141.1 trypsin-like peptidase domain-containing protein [Anaerolineaceae bacterium]